MEMKRANAKLKTREGAPFKLTLTLTNTIIHQSNSKPEVDRALLSDILNNATKAHEQHQQLLEHEEK